MIDKVMVSNRAALKAKYGVAGVNAIANALARLMAADSARGLRSRVIWIDNRVQMKKLGGAPPVSAKDDRGAKLAVDAIANSLSPDYIVLVDGPDVIPHIVLDNPAPADGDIGIDSDLPYACSGDFSRQPARCLAVTRVVGRIPNLPGAKDPGPLIKVIEASTKAKPAATSLYKGYFGLSAGVWSASTAMSLDSIFSDHTKLRLVPPSGPPGTNGQFANISHFINCHGASVSSEFYGQRGATYPVAMTTAQVSARTVKATVVAAECCYGAQLYDPVLAGIAQPICMAYLEHGALGFVGNGPANSNGQADLLAQYFMQHVTSGASLGRGFLQARQRFIANSKMTDPTNLKTLAQFIPLGDPSTQLCAAPKRYDATQGIATHGGAEDKASQRKARRAQMVSNGLSMAASKAVSVKGGRIPTATRKRISAIARERGFEGATETTVFAVRAPNIAGTRKTNATRESVMIVSKREKAPHGIIIVRHLVTHTVGKGIASIEEVVSR